MSKEANELSYSDVSACIHFICCLLIAAIDHLGLGANKNALNTQIMFIGNIIFPSKLLC